MGPSSEDREPCILTDLGIQTEAVVKIQIFFEISFVLEVHLDLSFHHQIHVTERPKIPPWKPFLTLVSGWAAVLSNPLRLEACCGGALPAHQHPSISLLSWCRSIITTQPNNRQEDTDSKSFSLLRWPGLLVVQETSSGHRGWKSRHGPSAGETEWHVTRRWQVSPTPGEDAASGNDAPFYHTRFHFCFNEMFQLTVPTILFNYCADFPPVWPRFALQLVSARPWNNIC